MERKLYATSETKVTEETKTQTLCLLPDSKLTDFIRINSPHPHCFRRRAILKKYPEIEKLYGTDPIQSIFMFSTVFLQFFISYYVSYHTFSYWNFFLLIYFISGTLNHSLFAAIHETSHGTVVPEGLSSCLLSIAISLPMAVPVAIPFTRYHQDHHVYLGVEGLDPDLPTHFEARLFQSLLGKFIWIGLLPFTYSLRPFIVNPKKMSGLDFLNIISVVIVDSLIAYHWGISSLLYLVLGTFFAMNYHPFAGHFISEHYVFPKGDSFQETNSYYGFMNYFTYNLGYHVEHHDFPRIPGRFLPKVSSIAKEFYSMPQHPNWSITMWKFITTSAMTPFNRIFRPNTLKTSHQKTSSAMSLEKKVIPFGGVGFFWPSESK